jgi:cell division protein FtsI/penicillin-binding protein 2
MTRGQNHESAKALAPISRRADRVGLLAGVVISVVFVALLVRVVQLQVAPPEQLRAHIDQRISAMKSFAPRGDILDRRGRLLAATRVGHRLIVDPAEFPEPYEQSLARLVSAGGLDATFAGERLFTRLARNERAAVTAERLSRYVRLSDLLDDAQVEAIRALRMRGVHLEMMSVREGPGAQVAAAVLGRVDAEDSGQFGAERLFDPALESAQGQIRYVRDAKGRGLWIERGGNTPPVPGESIRLSIDAALQDIAEEELIRAVIDADAQGGRLLLIDPHTGEVLALVDFIRDMDGRLLPWGERSGMAEDAALGGPRRTIIQPDPMRLIHPGAGRNRNFTDLYEPGSTFKAFTWAVMTAAGVAKPGEVFKTGGQYWRTPYGRQIRDAFGKSEQTWREVLVNSSNIGMSMVAERMEHRAMHDALMRFGFEETTGVGLPGEIAGGMTSMRDWRNYTQTSVSFGQEVAVTPAQLARAFCAFAREGQDSGTLPTLSLRAADDGPGAEDAPSLIVQRAIDPAPVLLAREAMSVVAQRAVDNMKRLKLDGITDDYRIFGKSGTAQVSLKGERGYLPDQYISSFVGGAPYESPRLVCLVTIDDPSPELVRKRQHFGSWVAAPAVKRVMERSLRYLGERPSPRPVEESAQASVPARE